MVQDFSIQFSSCYPHERFTKIFGTPCILYRNTHSNGKKLDYKDRKFHIKWVRACVWICMYVYMWCISECVCIYVWHTHAHAHIHPHDIYALICYTHITQKHTHNPVLSQLYRLLIRTPNTMTYCIFNEFNQRSFPIRFVWDSFIYNLWLWHII
jgi:hypothetical protein